MKNIFMLSVLFLMSVFSCLECAQAGTYQMFFNGKKTYLVNTEVGIVYSESEWSSNDDEFHPGFGINRFIYVNGWAHYPVEQGGTVNPFLKDK